MAGFARIGSVALALLLSASGVSAQTSTCPLLDRLGASRAESSCTLLRQSGVRPAPDTLDLTLPGRWLLSPVSLHALLNSAYADPRERGETSSGRGLAAALVGALRWEWRGWTVSVSPTLVLGTNASFDLPTTPTGDVLPTGFGPSLDRQLRPIEGAELRLADGGSFVQFDAGPVRAGLSSERLWLGPSRRYPILLGSGAPGFRHVFVESSRPVTSPVGSLEGGLLWGVLKTSDAARDVSGPENRLLTVLHLAWRTGPHVGLRLGGYLTYQEPVVDGLDASYLFGFLDAGPTQSDRVFEADGKLGFHAEWEVPRTGIAVYGEVVRDDFWLDVEDLITQPEHSVVTTLGLDYRRASESEVWRVGLERSDLTNTDPQWGPRGRLPFYSHGLIEQGHTHRGHVLGASIGSGAIATSLRVARTRSGRMLEIELERVDRQRDVYYEVFRPSFGDDRRDVETGVSVRGDYPLLGDPARVFVRIARRSNRAFTGIWEESARSEWNLTLGLDWYRSAGRLPTP